MLQFLAHFADFGSQARWKLVAILFVMGLLMRIPVFREDHREGDELIYMSLVAQLDAGHGYTLHGSPIIDQGIIDKEQYDRPLFFHPPGGTLVNWLFWKIFGQYGFPLVQVFSYALFFWSMILLAQSLNPASTNVGMAAVAILSAFSPIMAHVTTKFWLDGPLLAFTTLGAAVFIRAVTKNKVRWSFVSGILLGFASLIKAVAFLVIPGLLLLAWFLLQDQPKPAKKWKKQQSRLSRFLGFALILVVTAVLIQIPWEIWQWVVCGSPFPGWAGKPSDTLLANNDYVYFLTVVRSPWIYLTLTVRVLWTLIPAVLLYFLLWKKKTVRQMGFSLFSWILIITLFHVMIGYWGYSKVLRYIILITPASIILFALLLDEAVNMLREKELTSNMKRATVGLIVVSVAAVFMEVATGVYTSFAVQRDLILPILGKFY